MRRPLAVGSFFASNVALAALNATNATLEACSADGGPACDRVTAAAFRARRRA
jgi:hypothetical protein